jgi:hypothetical protein
MKGSANHVGSALSTGDPPGWRFALVDGDPGRIPREGGRSPISLLSANGPARESSVYRTDGQYELTEEVANSSGSLHNGTDLEQSPYVEDEQIIVQPCLYEAGDKDEEGMGAEGDERDESGFPSNWKDAQTRAKVSQAARAGSSYKQRARAMVMSKKTEGRRPLARSERKPLVVEERGKQDDTESDDASDEEEDEVGDVDDDDSDGDEEGEDGYEEDEHEEVVIGIGKRNATTHAVEEHDGLGNNRGEQDADDHYEDEQTSDYEEDQIEEADEEENSVGVSEEKKVAGEEDRTLEERRKRPLERSEVLYYSTPEERPNKRSKGDGGENVDGAATNDSPIRTVSPETTPQTKTSSSTLTTASPGSTIEVVRQTSVVPGLQYTEKAVWDAAQRDSVINSLPCEQQTKMIHTALSLGSKEGIEALRCFVHNARKDGRRRGKDLHFDSDPSTPHSSVDVWYTTSTLVSRDSGLAYFSNLYRQIDILDNKVTLFSISKRVKLAVMAQYRKSLLQEGAGRNQAKDANLHLFRAVYPDHATIEKPDDKETSSAAHEDWNRLRDRLREGRMWLKVRDLFGGVGAFLALPPQCVPDRYVLRMPARNFDSWLRLLEVVWRALDTHARQTLNDLVRMSLARQPLPKDVLVLETLENGPSTAPTSLSDILTGWSSFERKSRDGEGEPTTPTPRREDDDVVALGTPSTTASTTNIPDVAEGLGLSSRQVIMGDVNDADDGLLMDLNFDDGLSQEI